MNDRTEQKEIVDESDTTAAMKADAWARRLANGPLSADEARAFNQWMAAGPENEARFQAAKALIRELKHVAASETYANWMKLEERERNRSSRFIAFLTRPFAAGPRWALTGLPVVATLVLAVFVALPREASVPVAPPAETVATQVAEVRTVELPDGSSVTIGAASSIDVAYGDNERRVILSAGEAFFEVEKDADRPFIVAAGNTLVRVLGTKFDVSLGTDAIDVAVSEGRVEVIRTERDDPRIEEDDIKHVLIAGQKVTAPRRGQVRPVSHIDAGDVASWRRGELQWADTPIRDIIADLNRYSPNAVILEARGTGDLEYTLAVQADEVDEAVALIAASLDLKVIERANGDRVLRR